MSKIEVDKVDPQSGTALEIGTSGDTVTVPSGVGLTLTDSTLLLPTTITSTTEVKTNKISPATGVAFALGDSGDTFTVPSGATISNLGTATGFGLGKMGQVVQTIKTDTTSTTNATYEDMTGMSRTITPVAASSKILIMASLFLGNEGMLAYRCQRDVESAGYATITEWLGDAAGSREVASQGGNWSATGAQFSGMYLDTPTYSLTDVITYKLQWTAENYSGALYLNRTTNDADNVYHVRSASTLTLMEVLA